MTDYIMGLFGFQNVKKTKHLIQEGVPLELSCPAFLDALFFTHPMFLCDGIKYNGYMYAREKPDRILYGKKISRGGRSLNRTHLRYRRYKGHPSYNKLSNIKI